MSDSFCALDIRSGNGFDVHRLEIGEGLWICGIFIPCALNAIGHSDADVALHALTDALLGAACAGDIGTHFPPTDSQWHRASSHIFLDFAHAKIKEAGGRINHVDLTILAEHPKISPYRAEMTKKLSELLGLDTRRINIKATTTEKLGFIGRSEGIAAFATATVSFGDTA